jgi:biotin carboxyl carrier protein
METKFKITVNGKVYDVTVEDRSEGDSKIIPSPGDMVVPNAAPVAAAPAPAAGADAGPDDRASPLAGVVASIQVTVGESVNAGDVVAEIEAMKMKTKVTAHKSGTVSNIAVKVGDAVDAGSR